MRLSPSRVAACLALGLPPVAPAWAEPPNAAVFDFQFAKGASTEPTEEERARLRRTGDTLRTLLTESGRYTVVATDPVRDAVAKSADLRSCNGCAEDFAKQLGADTAITGEVQKVSNLILNINVYVKPLREGAPEQAYSVDLRGNTDESFDRGIRYLVKNRMLDGR
ncbi:DUF3280 domain-containing protein [Methylobacterium sp. Leaf118]|uniref:DUF3280 domain-containing protein n=1 Tax=Methylobacterium sp. Leaf118 TaxID=2876562 RepID=UPI001E2B4057|nr:DUF3280 domain-containing protein [Methylobacterium sp. Leaf118]